MANKAPATVTIDRTAHTTNEGIDLGEFRYVETVWGGVVHRACSIQGEASHGVYFDEIESDETCDQCGDALL